MEKEQPTEAPRHSFRVVGGHTAARVDIKTPESSVLKGVGLVSIRKGRFLVVPIRDIPMDGYSLKEDGYEAGEAKGHVEAAFGSDVYLDGAVWAAAIERTSRGGRVTFVLAQTSIDVEGGKKFPIEIQKST